MIWGAFVRQFRLLMTMNRADDTFRFTSPIVPLRRLAGEVVNQAIRVFDVASRKIWLVLDDLTALFHKECLSFFYIVHGHFQNGPQRRPRAR